MLLLLAFSINILSQTSLMHITEQLSTNLKMKKMEPLSKETILLLNIQDKIAFEKAFLFYYPRLVYFANEYVNYDEAKNESIHRKCR